MRKEVLIYFAGKLVPAAVNLAIIILAVRFLGKAEYGKYSLVFYATVLLSTFSFGWVQQGILRFLSAYPGEQRLVINRFYFLTLLGTLFAAVTGVFICLFYFDLGMTDTILVILYLFLYNIFLFHLTLNQAGMKPVRYAMLEGTYNLLNLVIFLVLVLVFAQHHFIVLFTAMVLALAVTETFRIVLMPGGRAGLDPRKFHFDAAFGRKVFSYGFPLTLWLLVSYLTNISDRFIIKEFSTYDEVGTYSAVKDFIIKISTFTTMPVLIAYYPKIAERWNRSRKQEAMALIGEGLRTCLVIAVAVIIPFMILRNQFYARILHLEVSRDLLVSATLIIAAFLWQAAMLLHKPLELLLKPGLLIVAIAASLAVNTLSNLIFVPLYGYPAAAVAYLVSVLTYLTVVVIFVRRFRRQGLLKQEP